MKVISGYYRPLTSTLFRALQKGIVISFLLSACEKEPTDQAKPDIVVDYEELAANSIDQRIYGLSKQPHVRIFSTQDHDNAVYVRNPDCWAFGIDLTCISPWNSKDGNLRAGTLITPRHILLVAHYNLKAGDKIRFVDGDDRVVEREIIFHKNYTDWSTNYPDIALCILDTNVPSSVRPVLFLESGYTAHLSGGGRGLPALCLDQEEKALVSDILSLDSVDSGISGHLYHLQVPSDSFRLAFYEEKVMGDSGNPVFLVMDDQLVLIGLLTFGGAGSGSSMAYFANNGDSSGSVAYPDLDGMIRVADSLAGISTGYRISYFVF